MTFKMEWYGDQVLNASKIVLKNVSKEVANNVMEDAKRILKQKADNTTVGGLLDQFSIQESKFKDGGYLVYCQGPKNWKPKYHASFFELGTPITGVHPYGNKKIPPVFLPAHPFMRPAARKNIRKATQMYQEAMDNLSVSTSTKKTIDPRLIGGGMTWNERMGF